jgi:dephospho-CoA kinase
MAVPILGVTGGIATGKSSFANLLSRQTGATLFDADRFSRQLLASDPGVRDRVRLKFGDGIFDASGAIDRARLRGLVFADAEKRRVLEEILHPVIRARWTSMAAAARAAGEWMVVDIPLLFETDAAPHFDAIIVVACRAATQMERLLNNRNLDNNMAANIIAAQMDLNLKISRARHVAWNDGPMPALEAQAALLAGHLKQLHG